MTSNKTQTFACNFPPLLSYRLQKTFGHRENIGSCQLDKPSSAVATSNSAPWAFLGRTALSQRDHFLESSPVGVVVAIFLTVFLVVPSHTSGNATLSLINALVFPMQHFENHASQAGSFSQLNKHPHTHALWMLCGNNIRPLFHLRCATPFPCN